MGASAVTRAMPDLSTPISPSDALDNCEFVHGLLEQCLANDELSVPLLPEVAVRVARMGPQESTNARELADVINADPALTMYVLRIARSAAKRPASPIGTLQHAIAWLGFDEVATIAFTLALQGKMLDVKGQQHKARRLWRHSLASALWSRQLAHMVAREPGMCYLCGLVHNIGKVVTLSAVHELAQRAGKKLTGAEYDRLIETFHRHIGARVVTAWVLPPPVLDGHLAVGGLCVGRRRPLRKQRGESCARARRLHPARVHAAGPRSGGRECGLSGSGTDGGGQRTLVRCRGGHQRRIGSISGALSVSRLSCHA